MNQLVCTYDCIIFSHRECNLSSTNLRLYDFHFSQTPPIYRYSQVQNPALRPGFTPPPKVRGAKIGEFDPTVLHIQVERRADVASRTHHTLRAQFVPSSLVPSVEIQVRSTQRPICPGPSSVDSIYRNTLRFMRLSIP